MSLFLKKGCFPRDCQEGNDPLGRNRGNGPLRKVGKRPIKDGKRPINANKQFSGTPPWSRTAPLKRPIIRTSLMSDDFSACDPGPEMAAPILWATAIYWLFPSEIALAHKNSGGGGGCGRAKWVPFVLLAFFPSFIALFGRIEGNPCSEASCGVDTCSLVLKAFQVVLGSPEYGLLKLPQHCVLKGKWRVLKRKNYKIGEKRQMDKWYPFHACTWGGLGFLGRGRWNCQLYF